MWSIQIIHRHFHTQGTCFHSATKNAQWSMIILGECELIKDDGDKNYFRSENYLTGLLIRC